MTSTTQVQKHMLRLLCGLVFLAHQDVPNLADGEPAKALFVTESLIISLL